MYYSLSVVVLIRLGCDMYAHGFASLARALFETLRLSKTMGADGAAKAVVARMSRRESEMAEQSVLGCRGNTLFEGIFQGETPTPYCFLRTLSKKLI